MSFLNISLNGLKDMRIMIALFLGIFFNVTAYALVPPKYLSVPQWQKCVGQVKKGTAQFICLPYAKPSACPAKSWKILTNQKLVDICPVK